MLDVVVLEAAQHVDDGIDFADIAEELVAQAFALACTLNQTRDIDERELGRNDLGRFRDLRDLVEPRIGLRDAADIGLDRAEGIVRGLRGLRLVSALNRVDLPTFGRPTIPQRKPI